MFDRSSGPLQVVCRDCRAELKKLRRRLVAIRLDLQQRQPIRPSEIILVAVVIGIGSAGCNAVVERIKCVDRSGPEALSVR